MSDHSLKMWWVWCVCVFFAALDAAVAAAPLASPGIVVELLGCHGDGVDSICRTHLRRLENFVNGFLLAPARRAAISDTTTTSSSSSEDVGSHTSASQLLPVNGDDSDGRRVAVPTAHEHYARIADALASSPTFRDFFRENEPLLRNAHTHTHAHPPTHPHTHTPTHTHFHINNTRTHARTHA